ncbi:MCE family protein [Sulfitobacter sp. JBTF-M27]|uniref:MCE family protein n=1 Tax=Sulfitobacter sediminilitoris TaxID=2698830 RepID=A0A6P0CEK9_9RHOB|nr:MlaD family protein [Sulfitobacter sediminilitoris]NEK23638.1 MCE family protein [Sulfitobacter sediminilitoris]
METRANYILIGVFTLLAILGTLAFFIWLASVQINRQYATYGILFEDVSGLDPSGDVLFNGISVGKVIGLSIYDKDPSKVFTTIEVDSTTPIRSNTVAQLQSQGVTGVSYISLAGGAPGAAPLVATEGDLPIIPSRRSTVQTLVEDAPDLLAEATKLLEQFRALTGPENQTYVRNILQNLDTSSDRLDQALNDFSEITGTVSEATAQITLFTNRLDSIGETVTTTLENADAALISAQSAFETADSVLSTSTEAIDSAKAAFIQAEKMMREDLPGILAEVRDVVSRTDGAIADLQDRTGTTIDSFADTAALLNGRLTELETTLENANTAFLAVTDASDSFDLLVDGDGTLLVAEAREVVADTKSAIATIERVVLDDLEATVTDIREAIAAGSAAVERVASDLTGLTGQFEPLAEDAKEALTSASALFDRSITTLDTIDSTLTGAEGAITAAESAFDAATGVMKTDLGPVLEDIRVASDRISVAVEDVTRDVPAIAEELRSLITRADNLVAQVQRTVASSTPGIRDFTNTGLPELTRFGAEARNLVNSLNSLVRRIERDPARFILDDRVPDYRR